MNTDTVWVRGHNVLCHCHHQILLRGWGCRACRVHGSKIVMHEKLGWKTQKEKVHLEDLGIDGVILK